MGVGPRGSSASGDIELSRAQQPSRCQVSPGSKVGASASSFTTARRKHENEAETLGQRLMAAARPASSCLRTAATPLLPGFRRYVGAWRTCTGTRGKHGDPA